MFMGRKFLFTRVIRQALKVSPSPAPWGSRRNNFDAWVLSSLIGGVCYSACHYSLY
jgi:hypothetical protein